MTNMSASIHLPSTSTVPQQAFPIPKRRSRNDHTMNMNGDYHHYEQVDPCGIDNSDESDHSHSHRKSNQATKRHTSQPILGLQVGGALEELASRHSIDYRATPRQQDSKSSGCATISSSRASHVRQIASSSPDGTRLRHVPRGPVARVRPSTPPRNTILTGCAILGIGVGPSTGTKTSKLDASCSQVAGPRSFTSSISIPDTKQISRSPHNNTSHPKEETRLRSSSSASSGSLDFDQSPAAERKLVRPLPALPDRSGSASKSTAIDQPVRDLSSPPSLNALPTPPQNLLDATPDMPSRAAAFARSPTTFNSNSKLRCTPQGTSSMTTNDKDQSEDESPTPTVPFPTPRRSATTAGRLPLSRDSKPPPLSIPRCLSFKGITQGARLSPSVIIRPPPLPLVNLPVLPSASAASEGTEGGTQLDERRRSRLMMSMPALPLQGSSRGTRGLEEVDDLEEDDEDEEEEGEEEEEDEVDEANEEVSGQSSASSSSRIETPRSSFDSETSLDEDDLVEEKLSATGYSSRTLSSTSSYETARAELPSPALGGSHHWDVVDHHVKGKAKQEDDEGGGGIDRGGVLFPTMGDLAGFSKTKGRGDRGAELRNDSLKVVATGDVKVARSYDSERLVLERVGSGNGSGSAGRARLNSNKPNSTDGKNGVSARHPLPLEPLGATGSTAAAAAALPVKGSNLGSPHLGDRAMKNCLLSVSTTTPLGSPKLDGLGSLSIGHHNKMYKRASMSLVDVRAIGTMERAERMEEDEDRKRSSRVLKVGVSSRKKNESAASQDKEGSVGHEPKSLIPENGSSSSSAEKTTVADGMTSEKTATPQESSIHPLRRRRSMPMTNPPSYSSLFVGVPPGLGMELKVQPREDEGKEKLPLYTNEIFLKAVMPRKMEFTSPGVQAKDRKWRHVLCVLEGTALRVYKCSPTGGVSAWWEHKVGVGVGDPMMDAAQNSGARAGDKRELGSALAREIELARVKKSEDRNVVQPLLNTPVDSSQELRSYSPLPKPQGQSHQSIGSHGVTKSAFTFAAQLLKPSTTRHSRSDSDASHASEPSTSSSRSRTSLSLSRDSTNAQTTSDGSGSVQSHLAAAVSAHLTIPGLQLNRSRPMSPASGTSQSSGKKKAEQGGTGDNDLIRVYTMQNAESGLGKDYTKRQHVIRVRLEGEQFLLQAKNVESVITWIEGLQCAANVALDLDERPMPAGAMLPRRRRRRRTAATAPATAVPSSTS